jgi:hypothetical protein
VVLGYALHQWKVDKGVKSGRKPNLVLANRIRLNVGKYPACELAWLFGISEEALSSQARRMGVSLKVRKDKA